MQARALAKEAFCLLTYLSPNTQLRTGLCSVDLIIEPARNSLLKIATKRREGSNIRHYLGVLIFCIYPGNGKDDFFYLWP